MRVLFVGPSLYGETPDLTGLVVRSPARQGDVARAVLDGAGAIGLVDGFFDAVAAPWHKEILFALERGVTMLGASSMGALRAAECAAFGMLPIGAIAQDYLSGALDDDAAVAISHGPEELGYPPLTEPLVNVRPTLDRLRELGLISDAERTRIWERAGRLYFKDRSLEALLPADEREELIAAYRKHKVNRKAADALLLVAELKTCKAMASVHPTEPEPSFFSRYVLPELMG
ncbi:TfuA-like protein [Devosia sp. A16]|uniref:TfuA-like protein n=1 Tax=Devosia sp. A16 TaxID=1736675 RepID=UPI0006D7683B|nr:TfuA-like protein [Devosia sp. A16]